MVHDWVSLSFMVHLFGKYIVHIQMWHFPMAEHETFPNKRLLATKWERGTPVVWAGEAWKAQLKGSLPYWQVLLEHEPRQNRSFE